MKKIQIKNNKKLLIVFIILLIVAILVPIGYALFSHAKEEDVKTKVGKINVELKEDWPELGDPVDDGPETYTEVGILRNTKKVYGHSLEELDAYVRVRCIPVVEYFVPGEDENEEGEWIALPVSQNQISVQVSSEDNSWVKQGDYWYYKNVLKQDQNTSGLDIKWEVGEIPSDVYSYDIRTDVRVILEYSQTTNGMWKEIFQIENLPDGVTVVE